MKVYAPAKVNLALDVLGQNEDGYHELDMIMAPVLSLYNVVDITPDDKTTITCTNGDIPDDNAMRKMVQVLKENIRFELKNIFRCKQDLPEQVPMRQRF